MRTFLSDLYRFKPLRTAAQTIVGLLVGTTILDVDWQTSLAGGALAGVVSFLQILGEGGDMLADDERITGTKDEPTKPVTGWGQGV